MVFVSCKPSGSKEINRNKLYPWCIVAYDSLQRSPAQRIAMLNELGFNKYAYDWRDRHLDNAKEELQLAIENDLEVLSVWLWLNAKRDSINQLSPSNERLFSIVKELNLNTTFWVSMSPNFFLEQCDEKSFNEALAYIQFIATKAAKINCKVALYNHTGWFGKPYNQVKILQSLPQYELSLVYNFHHAHADIDHFPDVVQTMLPYLSAVNLNGMRKGHKILPIGHGEYEKQMIQELIDAGFNGPWGILGHVEGADVEVILKRNIEGLYNLLEE
ncbi:MAG: hypothetical protein MI866_04525 [Bacteroidales bacterium]|nr:hypothetical protein [Bacteroidales bacterium]